MPTRPAKDRNGKSAWLAPASLSFALASWLLPFGEVLAAVAVGSGALSIATRGEYRIDWAAVVGISIATTQLYLALLLFVINTQP